MPELDLDAIEARAEAAPYGPWVSTEWEKGLGFPIWAGDGDLLFYADPPGGHYLGAEVEALVIHARSDILALVSRVRELEACVADLAELASYLQRRPEGCDHDDDTGVGCAECLSRFWDGKFIARRIARLDGSETP